MAKLGKRCKVAGLSLMKPENLVRTSGRPSRYQTGDFLYMGGATRKETPGMEAQASERTEQNSSRMGSMRLETMGSSSDEVKKLVTQDTMHTLLSLRMERRDSSNN